MLRNFSKSKFIRLRSIDVVRMDEFLNSLSSRISIDHASKIGQGSFGEVYLIREKSKDLKVVKRVEISHASPKDKASAVEEALILSRLCHPNILSLIDFFLGANDTHM